MAQSVASETGNQLIIEGRYHNTLDIEGFSKMMKDPSFCYKFYWLEAIVQLISEGIQDTTFDEIINEMICNAWYSVREFHIHLSGLSADGQVRNVFTGWPVAAKKYDIDHFIPWSFVMNDELWNLMPMDSSLNSSKSNKLPKWNPFFEAFSENQYLMYRMIQKKEELHRLFEACYRDNLHSDFPLITAFKMQNPMVNTGRSIRKDRNPSATFASRISPASHAHRAAVRAVR